MVVFESGFEPFEHPEESLENKETVSFGSTPARMEYVSFGSTPARMDNVSFRGSAGAMDGVDKAPSMEVQALLICDYIHETPQLQYENWAKLTKEERLEALNGLEKQAAEIAHRPAMMLVAGETGDELDRCANKYPNTELVIDEKSLEDDSKEAFKEALGDVLCQGRFAYQNYVLAGHDIEENEMLVTSWRMNHNTELGGLRDGSPDYHFHGGLEKLDEIKTLLEQDEPQSKVAKILLGGAVDNLRDVAAEANGKGQFYMQPVVLDALVFSETVMDKLEI